MRPVGLAGAVMAGAIVLVGCVGVAAADSKVDVQPFGAASPTGESSATKVDSTVKVRGHADNRVKAGSRNATLRPGHRPSRPRASRSR